MRVARAIRIEGRVQGVCFRDWTVETATTLGIAGWVRNRHGGSVEVLAVGDERTMEQFVENLGDGPPAAQVLSVEVAVARLQEFAGFTREPTA